MIFETALAVMLVSKAISFGLIPVSNLPMIVGANGDLGRLIAQPPQISIQVFQLTRGVSKDHANARRPVLLSDQALSQTLLGAFPSERNSMPIFLC
jgi:hypothetical protein